MPREPKLTPGERERLKYLQEWIKKGFIDYDQKIALEKDLKKKQILQKELERTRTQREKARLELEELYKRRKLEVNLPEFDFNDINDLKLWRDRFREYINNGIKRLELLQQSAINLGLLQRIDQFIESNRVTFRAILRKHAERALTANIDLNYPSWRNHLLKKIVDDRLITVVTNPFLGGSTDRAIFNGFFVDIRTNITEILGSINDYADVVRLTRQELDYGNKVGGVLASYLWYNRLWQVGRGNLRLLRVSRKKNITKGKLYKDWGRDAKLKQFYRDIMRTRLENMNEQAPYWVLLDQGILRYPASKGGIAKPEIIPTHFVTNAEKEISDYCNNYFSPDARTADEERIEKEISALNSNIYHLEEVESILNALIIEIDVDAQYDSKVEVIMMKLNLAFSDAISRAKNSETLKQIVSTQMDILANKIISGEEIGRRLYLYSSGKAQVRKRTVKLMVDVALAMKKQGLPDSNVGVIELAKKNISEMQNKLKALQKQRNR